MVQCIKDFNYNVLKLHGFLILVLRTKVLLYHLIYTKVISDHFYAKITFVYRPILMKICMNAIS